ncbi:hypothetical protein HRbin29_02327 [bacterium HR29]|jgi:membrane protein YdbS with pleckstrin-like domain|nr:hypothetical protein HRbin29_02327 [bacterium HR29]
MSDPCAEERFPRKPPRPWIELAPWPLASRGLGLLLLAAVFAALAWFGLRTFSWWFVPAAAVSGVAAVLALWAALIHLTGGEEFDDHPFV